MTTLGRKMIPIPAVQVFRTKVVDIIFRIRSAFLMMIKVLYTCTIYLASDILKFTHLMFSNSILSLAQLLNLSQICKFAELSELSKSINQLSYH